MFRKIRIAVLLLLLVFVALGAWLSRARSRDWDSQLWVAIYPINADGSDAARRYIDGLSEDTFASIDRFMTQEAERYGVPLADPVRVVLYEEVAEAPPPLDRQGNILARVWWSLRLRYWAWHVTSDGDRPPPDIRMFVLYHDPATTTSVPHSLGLQKGLLGIVYAFADRSMTSSNNIVIAHEFLHTLGATDKYNPDDDQPQFPDGFADPQQEPLYPQEKAEIMAGRRMVSDSTWDMPEDLRGEVVGRKTAAEINWPVTDE